MAGQRLLSLFLVLGLAAWLVPALPAADPHPLDPTKPAHDPAKKDHKEHTAMDHVLDHPEIELFESFGPHSIKLPKIFGFQITKFMVLQLVAALLIMAIYIPMGQRLKNGNPPRGAWNNAFEVLLVFVREQIAKPSLVADDHGHDDHDHHGHDDHGSHGSNAHHDPQLVVENPHPEEAGKLGSHPADRYVPFLWTLFLFILFNNLLGMIPFMGSSTGSIWVTLGLAGVVFFAIHGSAISKHGFGGYLKTLWPQIEVPGAALQFVIRLMVCVIEVAGVLVKNVVLAIRLFANMFAGHMVLATILLFIKMAANTPVALWSTITLSSILGIVALSLLELFVAFLQAYIFTFLTALFMGMALNPAH